MTRTVRIGGLEGVCRLDVNQVQCAYQCGHHRYAASIDTILMFLPRPRELSSLDKPTFPLDRRGEITGRP